MWYLVRIPKWDAPYWLQNHSKTFWMNINGGLTPKHEDDVIYEVVIGEYEDLDHKKTGLFLDCSDSGWLDPEGVWYPCRYHEHDVYAELIIKQSLRTLICRGWVRVWSNKIGYSNSLPLTSAQQIWLSEHGHDVCEGRL